MEDVEKFHGDIAEVDMNYDEFEELCRETSKVEVCNYLYFERSKEKSEGISCICNKSKKTILERFPELNPLQNHMN